MPRILIICYSFPPNPGVGGRRWAKFVKYLIKAGHLPVVISNQPKRLDSSPWLDDVKDSEVHFINYGYPGSLDQYPVSLFKKLLYRFYHRYIKLKKGNYYDRSLFAEKKLIEKSTQLIRERNIKTVIVSCPPFRHAWFASKLKTNFPEINLITDFRDPWTDNTTFLGFNSLSKKRLKYELKLEEEVISASDKIICVNSYYKELLAKKYPQNRDKLIHLMNGFDMDDIKSGPVINPEEIIVTCAGTIYNAVEFLFLPFLNFIDSESVFLRKNKIKFRIYGNVDMNVRELILKKHEEFLEIFPLLDSVQIHQKIASSSAVMMFIAPNHGDNFNTKFYEYLAHRKPIVLFSNKGEIADFIISNKLGVQIGGLDFHDALLQTLKDISSGSFEMNNKFNLSEFNIINLTDQLIKIISHD